MRRFFTFLIFGGGLFFNFLIFGGLFSSINVAELAPYRALAPAPPRSLRLARLPTGSRSLLSTRERGGARALSGARSCSANEAEQEQERRTIEFSETTHRPSIRGAPLTRRCATMIFRRSGRHWSKALGRRLQRKRKWSVKSCQRSVSGCFSGEKRATKSCVT